MDVDFLGLKKQKEKKCCCNGKSFDENKYCCENNKKVESKDCRIRIYIGHYSENMSAKLKSEGGLGGADRIAAVSCRQQDMNALIPESQAYPNPKRGNGLIWKDLDKDGHPTPTAKGAMDEEIAAAKTEADLMCDVATSRGLCCNKVTITIVAADKDGSEWLAVYYSGAPMTFNVHVKDCDKKCKERGGEWIVPKK
jgi:hypothetical protein